MPSRLITARVRDTILSISIPWLLNTERMPIFKNFVQQAHQRGLKVILDVTPNHTSSDHPFVLDARLFTTNSFYWTFYEHQEITNPNYHPNISEAITSDGFVYYSSFSDEILNYNWSDADARAYMIGVYTWWVKQMGLDGYRFDVYWGPHDRANGGNGGELEMGVPVRGAIKHSKPDVFILGETDGYWCWERKPIMRTTMADVDAAYDWNLLHNVIQPFNVSSPTLNNNVTNYGIGRYDGIRSRSQCSLHAFSRKPRRNSHRSSLRFIRQNDADGDDDFYRAGNPDDLFGARGWLWIGDHKS